MRTHHSRCPLSAPTSPSPPARPASPRPQAGGYPGLSWTIVRPTAYFKDFTDYPWQRMQVDLRGFEGVARGIEQLGD